MANSSKSITYWNRASGIQETEQVYGEALVRWLYSTPMGRLIADQVLSRKVISWFSGLYQSSKYSGRRIRSFIEEYKIPMEQYETGPFRTFNDFFIRKFRPGIRTFCDKPGELPAFAEGRYLAFEKHSVDQRFPVKGEFIQPEVILGDMNLARTFKNGPVIIARLCPTDYHRFHFPDDGAIRFEHRINGKLHSVNPVALNANNLIFTANERHVSILDTQNFGRMAYIEVGAMCVGKIVETHPWSQPFKRGQEKGYFLFGASTIILFGEPGIWKPSKDLVERTSQGIEALVRLGECIGSKI